MRYKRYRRYMRYKIIFSKNVCLTVVGSNVAHALVPLGRGYRKRYMSYIRYMRYEIIFVKKTFASRYLLAM